MIEQETRERQAIMQKRSANGRDDCAAITGMH
jgi:hypothetical protein